MALRCGSAMFDKEASLSTMYLFTSWIPCLFTLDVLFVFNNNVYYNMHELFGGCTYTALQTVQSLNNLLQLCMNCLSYCPNSACQTLDNHLNNL